MALIRGHHDFDDHFTQIPNQWVRDERLTLEARGLLAQIMSHRPGWNLSIKSLAGRNRVGRDKVRRILDELLKFGYLERSEEQVHDERGHLAGYDYFTRDPEGVTQEPCKAEPTKAEPTKAQPTKADKPPKKTIPKEQHKPQKNIAIERAIEQFWAIYPRRTGKGRVAKALGGALEKASLDEILAGVERYRDDPNREDVYTQYPATWLNAEGWEDDPLPLPVTMGVRKLTNAEQGALMTKRFEADEAAAESLPVELGFDYGLTMKGIDDE